VKRALLVVALGLVGLGCGGPGTAQPAAARPPAPAPPAAASAPRYLESGELPASGAPPPGSLAGDPIGDPAKAPVFAGPLSKEQIRDVMRANQAKVRYCYERELVKLPQLAGTVVVKFVVRADGGVASAVVKFSSLGNAAAEQCIAHVVTTFVFPPPLGGGIVVVSYPYQLQTTAAAPPAGQ
jgi:TonB family protein